MARHTALKLRVENTYPLWGAVGTALLHVADLKLRLVFSPLPETSVLATVCSPLHDG